MIRHFVAKAFASTFLRHATLLTSGTLLANLITLATLPLFARMFAAESFGIQGLLLMGGITLGTLATGYYDWAIPTPKDKRQARALATLAMMLTLTLAACSLVLLLLFGPAIRRVLDLQELGGWIYLIPFLALSVGSYSIGNYWLLRSGRIGLLTNIRFTQPVVGAALTFILGLLKVELGLLIGYALGTFSAGIWGLLMARHAGLRFDWQRSRTYYRALAGKFCEFPLYGSIPAAMMLLAGQIPLLVITTAYALGVTGHYSVVRNILYGGTLMMTTACGQVLLKHIAEHHQRGEAVWPHYRRILGLLAAAGVALAAAVYFISPWFFRLYLGAAWGDSAAIARMLAPVMPFWLMGLSLATAPIALRKLKPIAFWQVGYGLSAGCLFLFTDLPFAALLQRIVIFEILAYALCIATATATLYQHGR